MLFYFCKLVNYNELLFSIIVVCAHLQNYRLELHDTAGNIIHETMTVTDNGEYITMEDGNTAFYEFQKVRNMFFVYHKDRRDIT
jgi:hypothetical protein